MNHIPMCAMCGEYEVGTFHAHNDFCSDACADKAYDYTVDNGDGYDDILAVFDDDPSPYAGTYSEE